MSKATHIVVHPKQYLSVGGKLQHVPKGTEVALTPAKAKDLEAKGRILKIGQKEAVDLTDEGAKDPELASLKVRAAELGIEVAGRWGAKRLKEEIATAEAKAAGIDA